MAGPYTGSQGPAGSTGRSGGGADDLRGTARETIDSVKHEASDMAARAAEQGKSLLGRQKDTAAGHLDSVANALHGTARQLEAEHKAPLGRYVDYAARQLESAGRQLRDKDVDRLIGDARDLGRRAPGALFAGSVVAGFLLSRFLKSSAERHAQETPDARWRGGRDADPYDDGRSRDRGTGTGTGRTSAMAGGDLRSGAGTFQDSPGTATGVGAAAGVGASAATGTPARPFGSTATGHDSGGAYDR